MHINVPTHLTKEQIEEFKGIYLEEFKEEITDEEAERKAFILLRFVAAVLKLTKDMPKTEDKSNVV